MIAVVENMDFPRKPLTGLIFKMLRNTILGYSVNQLRHPKDDNIKVKIGVFTIA